jgi:hypothetical protein
MEAIMKNSKHCFVIKTISDFFMVHDLEKRNGLTCSPAGFEHLNLLSQPPECWDYRCVPPCPPWKKEVSNEEQFS